MTALKRWLLIGLIGTNGFMAHVLVDALGDRSFETWRIMAMGGGIGMVLGSMNAILKKWQAGENA